tara:strand:- start:154 stop:549 length:396 start_codon:yes stop_codon:yes gene_type:complete
VFNRISFSKVTIVVLSVILFSCYTQGIDGERRDRYHITQKEIRSVPQAETAWEVLEFLRPNLLTRDRRRHVGFTDGMEALVYINGARAGYKNRLHTIPAMDIVEIKYLDSIEAGGQYGFSSGGGVFLITMD